LPEILDTQTQAPLADGERGELVLTTLTRDAMPVLRYRTGDLTRIWHEPCACGRTTARIDWLTGRVDDMLVIRGVNVFPTAIETALLEFSELAPHYRIIVDRLPGQLDTLLVEVEHHAGVRIDDLTAFSAVVARQMSGALALSLDARVVAPATIERTEAGKVRRVFDNRK
jgi:phenylacetate-CoA ligase